MTEFINPTKDSFRQFREISREGPIHMLNLIALNETAIYADGSRNSGAAAYRQYGQESGPIFRRLGGRIIWSGRPELMLIGPDCGENWDIAFIAQYPDAAAFVSMIRDKEYQHATQHRTAAVRNARLIRMEPLKTGAGFGD